MQHRGGVGVIEQIKDIRADDAVGAIAVGGQRHRSIDEAHLCTVAPPRKPVSCQRDHHRADIHPEIARGRRQQFQHPHGQPARATTELEDGMRRLRCKVGEQPRHGAVFIELPILCPTDPVVYGPRLRRLHPRPVPRATPLRMADCDTTNTHFRIRSRQTLAKTSGPGSSVNTIAAGLPSPLRHGQSRSGSPQIRGTQHCPASRHPGCARYGHAGRGAIRS